MQRFWYINRHVVYFEAINKIVKVINYQHSSLERCKAAIAEDYDPFKKLEEEIENLGSIQADLA